ncbi:MAG: DUF1826 domain-containing protein [Pseudomonadota bacterium]
MGNALDDFAAIYEDDVELVSVSRPPTSTGALASKPMWGLRQAAHARSRWVQAVNDDEAPARELPPTVDAAVIEQIAQASETLGELLGCERVGVRLMALNAPLCPRFHVDRVPCRILITLSGEGTEWIPNRDVDWAIFADHGTVAPPVRANAQIHRLTTGHWSLLKGGTWSDGFCGVVHRSPNATGERLLLSLEPIA